MRILLFWIGGNHLYTDLYVNSKFIFCQELLIILNLSWILCYCFYLWWSFLNSYVLLSILLDVFVLTHLTDLHWHAFLCNMRSLNICIILTIKFLCICFATWYVAMLINLWSCLSRSHHVICTIASALLLNIYLLSFGSLPTIDLSR